MDIKQTYNEWLENAVEDKDLKAELENIKINYTINKAIKMLGGKKNG